MNITTKAGIYLLTNRVNGKIYVGKAINVSNRVRGHLVPSVNKTLIDRAIKKYGWENFSIEILESFNEINNDNLLQIEADWIKRLNSTDLSIGYNLCKSGTDQTGVKRTKEQCKRHSQMMTGKFAGENHPMFGKRHSQESIQKMSDSHKRTVKHGKDHHSFGKPKSLEVKEKLRLAHSTDSYNHLKRPVKQISLSTGQVIVVWESAAEAARQVNGKYNPIIQVCGKYRQTNGSIRRSAYGFGWEYVEKTSESI